MGSVRQAVLEFDAAVRVPWRPLLGSGDGAQRPSRPVGRAPLPGSGPRVAGHLRPVPDRPAAAPARTAGPPAEAPRARRDPARPGGRPPRARAAAGAVRGGRAAAPAPARLRLTRRGRRLVLALALGGAVALGSVVASWVPGGEAGLRLAGESSVVVRPGDTVWSIAGEVAGGGQDVRAVVDAIEELNDLEGAAVVPGQVLRLP